MGVFFVLTFMDVFVSRDLCQCLYCNADVLAIELCVCSFVLYVLLICRIIIAGSLSYFSQDSICS